MISIWDIHLITYCGHTNLCSSSFYEQKNNIDTELCIISWNYNFEVQMRFWVALPFRKHATCKLRSQYSLDSEIYTTYLVHIDFHLVSVMRLMRNFVKLYETHNIVRINLIREETTLGGHALQIFYRNSYGWNNFTSKYL